ncbi:MAG: signal peptidase II [Ruminococcaceae bacterium]|nr:signal peptidase II [Oscillospiraceae bacterium]
MLYTILIILLSIGADQLTKHLAVTHLMGKESYPFWENILHFTYVENRGAAFGMLKDHRWVFMLLSTAAIIAVLIWLFKDKTMGPWFRCAAALIVGGGVGNMIDRILLGYVVDFIDVVCIDFYVFNVADSCVCVGCGMFLVGLIVSEIKEAKAKKAAVAECGGETSSTLFGDTDNGVEE